ncbi:hypothetical protein PROFUN_01547 [Planoprotostelium fungivorum]|uniref:Uncharacterized protein n=1 Tax=Planoprotostelium fungivorum TaxID=1890364 RepID=A0A2P6NTI4_9EUKA|nr:hypothetical protein PROFUN_01547 [Planoprotostelium fungivorum]
MSAPVGLTKTRRMVILKPDQMLDALRRQTLSFSWEPNFTPCRRDVQRLVDTTPKETCVSSSLSQKCMSTTGYLLRRSTHSGELKFGIQDDNDCLRNCSSVSSGLLTSIFRISPGCASPIVKLMSLGVVRRWEENQMVPECADICPIVVNCLHPPSQGDNAPRDTIDCMICHERLNVLIMHSPGGLSLSSSHNGILMRPRGTASPLLRQTFTRSNLMLRDNNLVSTHEEIQDLRSSGSFVPRLSFSTFPNSPSIHVTRTPSENIALGETSPSMSSFNQSVSPKDVPTSPSPARPREVGCTEIVLKRLVSVCLLSSLVSKKIGYGEELVKRLAEAKEMVMLRKADLEDHLDNASVYSALDRLDKTLVRAEILLNKVRNTKLFQEIKYGKQIRTLLRDVITDSNNLGVNLTMAISKQAADMGKTQNITLNETQNVFDGARTEEEESFHLTLLGDRHFFGFGTLQSYEKAFQQYMTAASMNYAPAQNNLASMYEQGLAVETNYAEALHFYQKAAEQDYVEAINNLGRMHELGRGTAVNFETATQYYSEAISLGHFDAMNNLGYLYEKGKGVQQNYEEAAKYYASAVEGGHAVAKNNLGSLYFQGKGVIQSYETAVDLFLSSSREGNTSALNNLGICYEEGKGVLQDNLMATRYYMKATEKGNHNAMNNLGYQYLLQREYEKAGRLFRAASDSGNLDAMYNIGIMHERGLGDDKNIKLAFKWFQNAAEGKHARAMNKIAAYYFQGLVVLQDYAEAFHWYSLAAAENDTDAQNNMGIMYEEGIGVEQDLKAALKWYSICAEQNHSDGLYNLAMMSKEGRGVKQNLTKALQLFNQAYERGHAEAKLQVLELQAILNNQQQKTSRIRLDF